MKKEEILNLENKVNRFGLFRIPPDRVYIQGRKKIGSGIHFLFGKGGLEELPSYDPWKQKIEVNSNRDLFPSGVNNNGVTQELISAQEARKAELIANHNSGLEDEEMLIYADDNPELSQDNNSPKLK